MYRSILITGGAGFIGSHVVDAFARAVQDETLQAGKIIVADVFDYCASTHNLKQASSLENVVVLNLDICDAEAVRGVFRKYRVDAVVHLAAQSHVDRSFGNSLTFTDVNVRGTHTLLEVAREEWSKHPSAMQGKRFLHISTDEVYGPSCETERHCEATSLLQPTNPYAASKAAAEMYVESYRHSYGIPTIVSRSNNVYGPRQYPEKVIPKFILRLQAGLAPRLQGDGSQQRSFLYVTDAANALLTLFLHGSVGNVYNIGADDEITIKDLARVLTQQIQPKLLEKGFAEDADRPFNDRRYHLSTERIRDELEWSPQVPFKDGLAKTIQWYANADYDAYWDVLPTDLFVDDNPERALYNQVHRLQQGQQQGQQHQRHHRVKPTVIDVQEALDEQAKALRPKGGNNDNDPTRANVAIVAHLTDLERLEAVCKTVRHVTQGIVTMEDAGVVAVAVSVAPSADLLIVNKIQKAVRRAAPAGTPVAILRTDKGGLEYEGFFQCCKYLMLEHKYGSIDFVFKMHTDYDSKQAPRLMVPVCGSGRNVQRCVRTLLLDRRIGQVAARWATVSNMRIEQTASSVGQVHRLFFGNEKHRVNATHTYAAGGVYWYRWSLLERYLFSTRADVDLMCSIVQAVASANEPCREGEKCVKGLDKRTWDYFMSSWARARGYKIKSV